jgi:two-component system response regulator
LEPPPSILLVDADARERDMLRDALLEGTVPFELEAVATAAELEAIVHTSPRPNLIVVDLDRDAAEAFGTIDRLKVDPHTKRIPVIALTGRRDEDRDAIVAHAYEAGVATVLPKPVTFLALVRLVKVVTAYWLEAALLPPAEAA